MDEAGFHARRRADREERDARRAGRLGQLHGMQNTAPLSLSDDEIQDTLPPPVPDKIVEGGKVEAADPSHRQPIPAVPGMAEPMPAPRGSRRRMEPYLSVMLGPILRYDTVVNNVYHAFALIVTSDLGSVYSPAPSLQLEWDPTTLEHQFAQTSISSSGQEADSVQSRTVEAQRIYVYQSRAGPQSFWRFKLEIPLGESQQEIFYSVNGGPELSFFVPAFDQNMRWVAHSCNGFSAGVDTAAFNGSDPLWSDVLREHEKAPFHLLVGGGDQIYCDPLTREPEIEAWITEHDDKKKIAAQLTPAMEGALNSFYFNHYCKWFRSGKFGTAIQRIPMANMADDHDLIDGFGSYPDDLMSSPVFSGIGRAGLFWYSLFQTFIVDEYDGTNLAPGTHSCRSIIIGGPGAWVPYPSKSFLTYLGPKVFLCLLDTRSERKKHQICTQFTYDRVFSAIRALPPSVEHLVLLLGVPLAYPRMTAIETVLESKLNPLTILGKSGAMGLSGFVNKFNKEAELLDDLNDHWCAKHHKEERNWLVAEMQKIALFQHLRVTFLSGDVHAAAVSKFETIKHKDPKTDPKYMLQIITSAIVNTPPPHAVLLMVSTLGKKRHKTLHHVETDEELLPLFQHDTDGSKHKMSTIMGRRNYSIVTQKPNGDLEFDIRVEIKQGSGTTKSYPVSTPAPAW